MTIELPFGWWALPAMFTLVSFFVAWRLARRIPYADDYGVGQLLQVSCYGAACIPALIGWLIWAVLV